MADINQFGSAKPVRSGEGTSCAQCEAMLLDAIDGTLSPKDQAAFDRHIATCAECSQMLADAKRGAALLEILKTPRPEPSASLMERILAQTSGQISGQISTASTPASSAQVTTLPYLVPSPAASGGTGLAPAVNLAGSPAISNVLPFRSSAAARFNLRSITHTLMQPRLAMTAAMAFFSIALTMNLTGVHLSQLSASDLKPSSLKRSFYQADASVVRYYDNLRVVYELESRVRDLQRSNDNDSPSASPDAAGKSDQKSGSGEDSDKNKAPKKAPKAGSGTSLRRAPFEPESKLAAFRVPASRYVEASRGNACIASLSGPDFVVSSNKSKEEVQEGDSV